MIHFVFVTLLAFVQFGCRDTDTNRMDIEFTTVGKGILGGMGQEGFSRETLVITQLKDWILLMDRMDKVNPESTSFAETDIDFDEFMILAVFDELKSSGGYDIQITSIEAADDELIVTVKHSGPGPASINVFTQPFHIVKTRRSDKQITFREI